MRTYHVVLHERCGHPGALPHRRFLLGVAANCELGILALARIGRLTAVCGLLAALTVLPARAADVGSAFSYQGFLEKPAGMPLTDICTLEFKLCDDAMAACAPGTISNHPGISVTDGVFTVADVDFGPSAFTGDARWLEIYVQCTGDGGLVALAPRVELTPAPYALRATEGVGPLGALNVTTTGEVGIGTESPTQKLDVVGNIHASGGISSGNTLNLCGNGSPGPNYISTDTILEFYVQDPSNQQIANTCLNPPPVPSARALRLQPGGENPDMVNVIGGHVSNNVPIGVEGATIGGGSANGVTSDSGTVGGGSNNTAGFGSTVAGGFSNPASGPRATVGGGSNNRASGPNATIGGGANNTASGPEATIGGGAGNTASGSSATIPGGLANRAQGDFSFAAGLLAKADHNGTFVWADHANVPWTSTGVDQFLIRATGGVGIGTTSPEHPLQVNGNISVYGNDSTLLFGQENVLPGNWGEWGIEYWPNAPGGGGLNFWKPAGSSGIGFTNNILFLADSTGNVGINIDNPLAALHVGGTPTVDGIMFPDGTLQTTAAVTAAGFWASSGSDIYNTNTGFVGIGNPSPAQKLDVTGNIHASGTLESGNAIIINGTTGVGTIHTTGSKDLQLSTGGVSPEIFIKNSNGRVGIGTATPISTLDVAGTIHAAGNVRTEGDVTAVGWVIVGGNVSVTGSIAASGSCCGNPSDIRLKKNIKPISGALEKVTQLRGVNFRWKGDEFPEMKFSEEAQIGLIAQEVGEVLPEVVVAHGFRGYQAIDYGKIVPVLVEAVKEQQSIIDANQCELDELRTQKDHEITELRERMGKLEAVVNALAAQSDGGGR